MCLTSVELTKTKTGGEETWSCSGEKVGFDFATRLFCWGGEAESEDSQQPNAHPRRKLTSPPPPTFNLLVLRLFVSVPDTCEGDAFEALSI